MLFQAHTPAYTGPNQAPGPLDPLKPNILLLDFDFHTANAPMLICGITLSFVVGCLAFYLISRTMKHRSETSNLGNTYRLLAFA